MATPYDALTLEDARKLLGGLRDERARAAREFFRADHWQGGQGWIGATPPQGAEYGKIMSEIQRGFISENLIREVVKRHQSGVLGHEPLWRFTVARPLQEGEQATRAEQAQINDVEAALTTWWDTRKVLASFQQATNTALLTGRAVLRLFVPPGLRAENGILRARDLPDALSRIYVDVPDPEQAGTFTDLDTRREVGLFAFRRGNQDAVEVTYQDSRGLTVLRILTGQDGAGEETALPLNGRLFIYELRREALITSQVQDCQRGLNLALTQLLRNVNLAGNLERIVLNAQLPGAWVDARGMPWVEGQSTGVRTWQSGTYTTGAGATTFLSGLPVFNQEGQLTGYSNPNVSFREPVAIDSFAGTREVYEAAILGQCDQRHVLMARDATASGESRKQARAEYEMSLRLTKSALDDAGRWLLGTVLALGSVFSGAPLRFEGLRPEFNTVIDAGPITADERREIINEYSAGVVSRETTMSRLGIEDTDAEAAKIEEERQVADALLQAPFIAAPPASGTAPTPLNPAQALARQLGR